MLNPLNRSRSRHRKQEKRQRQLSWFSLALTAIAWTVFFFLIIFVTPELVRNLVLPNSYLPFFILLFFALCLTFWQIFHHLFRTLLYTSCLLILLFLQLKALGHPLSTLVIAALLTTYEIFFGALSKHLPFSDQN